MSENYYSLNVKEVLTSLKTSEKGLTKKEAEQRSDKYGINEIEKRKKITPLQIFVRQFTSFIVVILLAAIVISLLIGERLDAIVISIIVVLNGVFGFVQEYKAEKAIEALRKLTALKAKVIRNGQEIEIDSKELVPGDIILLETGSKVPADARLIQVAAFQVDEASLTGESVPSKKVINSLKEGIQVTDQENMVFMGTIITKGHAKAVITDTGMNTEIGKIAEMVQEVKEKLTPLQEKLKQFGKWLGVVTIGICAVVFGVGVLRQYLTIGLIETAYASEMFLAAVALAVAAIPEGLPAVVTISLALGVKRMAKRNALIRQLPAVETLGCTNFICSDKTGTLTKNEMTVREIYANNALIKVTGEGYGPEGKFIPAGSEVLDTKNIELLLRLGALCNDSRLNNNNNRWKIFGDPTEGALLVSAGKAGFKKKELEKHFPRIDEIPFDSERKCMTTIHKINRENAAYVKGAPDVILTKCKYIDINGKVKKLTGEDKKRILNINQDMANKALRVLGFAYKPLTEKYKSTPEEAEKDLIFAGLQAMIDPPREEVKEAIVKCKTAGIEIVVITGDHKLTAVAIAKELGLFKEGDKALSGDELDNLNDEKLDKIIEDIVIYARVSPEHKVRILNALKKKGHIVAMTGDGVNDAPALKKSDIGIAMGITGTDVAKEASDMVLTDDNFAAIVNAVEEGRGIYNSIKQFVQYTLSSNLGEIVVVFLAILIGWPLPLIAIQILWVNLLTDGLPGLALGLDPFSKDIMKNPPRKRKENIISKEVIQNILTVGFVMGIGTLFMFYSYGVETDKARSIAFTTLIMFQLFNVLTYRAKNFKINIETSGFLIGSVIISVLMQLAVLYTPLNVAFKIVPLGLFDWIKILLVSCTLYIILESRKMFMNYRETKP
ncbi:MAG: calcium-translocating P-type ATPase, SERCA-type [Proteobacteria bacterium]|nr:calcium-translocating P-type ATPase, SERCA-type [Pseudomonadota bacterium]MBU4288602.1 calcium-translocating P-type ATPase, SERCA-type [Pseudomonadota bacterium]MBU4414445.1 calcium-translocating P-type ATPase, SERCA-type [Pseudomonadota bacterium]